MSVDTYLKGKNLSRYRRLAYDDVEILVAPSLFGWAKQVVLDTRQFLLWKSFEVEAEHRHTITCAH